MSITYAILAFTGFIGSLIAVDEIRVLRAKRSDNDK